MNTRKNTKNYLCAKSQFSDFHFVLWLIFVVCTRVRRKIYKSFIPKNEFIVCCFFLTQRGKGEKVAERTRLALEKSKLIKIHHCRVVIYNKFLMFCTQTLVHPTNSFRLLNEEIEFNSKLFLTEDKVPNDCWWWQLIIRFFLYFFKN